ncbi:hypothetical protein NE237_008274 [Protea cynaroides]|uniref:Uncharacterized protein n=1 Tax=Protea cynaroides TaxID=273540 RepID=A0A9Q0JTR6_9MAGN|nr:hypothetical protein NE237_008274 [Protea cynaroides]
MLAAGAISQFVYAKRWQTSVALRRMLVEGAMTAVIVMPQEVGQLVIYYDMWEHLWILQILSDRLLGLAEMVPSHSLGFPSEEHMVAVPVGGCDGATDHRLQGRGALKEADELNPMRVDGVAILHVEDEVLRDDGNWGMFMLAQIKLMATTMAGVCMTQMAKVNLHLVRFPGMEINLEKMLSHVAFSLVIGSHVVLDPCREDGQRWLGDRVQIDGTMVAVRGSGRIECWI